jgi:glutamine amidotransferase
LPHVGWNSVYQKYPSELFRNIPDGKDFYFVHSYKFEVKNQDRELGISNYGQPFASAISEQNVFGVQFHPEKSQTYGIELLRNFVRIS